jgi:hypothetical protein
MTFICEAGGTDSDPLTDQLTRHLTTLFPEVLDEVQLALNESVSTQGDGQLNACDICV